MNDYIETNMSRNVIADIVLSVCKMEMLEYTVILANSKNIENLKAELDKRKKKAVFVNAPVKDDQIYIVKDEKTKYSILSEKGIIVLKWRNLSFLDLNRRFYMGKAQKYQKEC